MHRILIIEDEFELRESIAEILMFEGFDVHQAENGEEGIKVASELLPDLILCDIMMPGKTGFEVLEALNKDTSFTNIPFVFITALGDRGNTREGMNLGADDYLTKPFTKDELLDTINSKLKKYKKINSGFSKKITEIEKGLREQMENLQAQNTKLAQDVETTREEVVQEAMKAIDTNNNLRVLEKEIDAYLSDRAIKHDERKHLVYLKNKINKKVVASNGWTIFQMKFNQTYPNFTTNLIKEHKNLTEYELLLSSSLLSGLNNNQIADLLNVTIESARKSKYRLKKKLGLQKEDDLVAYIATFNR